VYPGSLTSEDIPDDQIHFSIIVNLREHSEISSTFTPSG